MPRHRAIACTGLLVALTAGVPSAQASWSVAKKLGHPVNAVAGNARGEEAMLWQVETGRSVLRHAEGYATGPIRARMRRADGRLSPPQRLLREGSSSAGIALDARGSATALMAQIRGDHIAILVSVRSPGGRFGAPVQLGRTSYVPEPLDIAVAPNGAAVVAWNDGSHIRAARRPAGRCPRSSPRACFGAEQNLGERCPSKLQFCIDSLRSLAVTIGPRGRPSVAWMAVHHNGELFASVIRFARGRGAYRFTAPRTISHGAEPSIEPTLAALHDDSVVAAWSEAPTHLSARIVAAVLDEDGRESRLRTLSIKGCHEPRASVSPDDEVTLAWRCRAGDYDERHIFLAIRPAGADFGPQVPIAPGDAVEPVVVTDAHGISFVFYTADDIHVRIRPPGQELGVDRRFAAGGYPHVVAAGERVTTFVRSAGNHTAMRDWIPE